MMRYVVMVGLLALAGCAAQRQAAIQARFDDLVKRCKAIPEEVGHYVERNKCRISAAREAGFSGQTEDLMEAERMALAERVDTHQTTPTQARLEFEEFKYRLRMDAAAAQTQRTIATAAALSAIPQPHSTTCTRIGTMTQCNGY